MSEPGMSMRMECLRLAVAATEIGDNPVEMAEDFVEFLFPTQQPALPDIEEVSSRLHERWMESKRAAGVNSRKLESGEELMVPYEELSEEAKQLDRGTVQAVYDAILSAEWE